MFVLKTLVRQLILPPNTSLILLLIGVILIARRRRYGWAIFLVGFVSLWLLSTPIIANQLGALVERYPALDIDRAVDAQAVVVLGGGGGRSHAPEYKGAMADGEGLDRVAFAAFLARHYSLPVAVSGAPYEAAQMSQTLSRNFGIPPRWVEGRSRDTFENARLSARILLPAGIHRIILVTSSWHEWRAAHEFMDAGFNVIPAPAGLSSPHDSAIFDYVPSAGGLRASASAVYELIGEPMRRLQAALGVREKFDQRVQAAPATGAP